VAGTRADPTDLIEVVVVVLTVATAGILGAFRIGVGTAIMRNVSQACGIGDGIRQAAVPQVTVNEAAGAACTVIEAPPFGNDGVATDAVFPGVQAQAGTVGVGGLQSRRLPRQTCLGVAVTGVPTCVVRTFAGRTGVWKPHARAVAGILNGEGEPVRNGDIGRTTERELREWQRLYIGSSKGGAQYVKLEEEGGAQLCNKAGHDARFTVSCKPGP